MEKVEIKNNKTIMIAIIIFFSICVIGSTYLVFFTARFAQAAKFIIIPVNLFALYLVYQQVIRLLNNYSIITLTRDYIQINVDGNPLKFPWAEIKELTIEKRRVNKSDLEMLTIKSDEKNVELNLLTLDKSVHEIRGLISNYRPL